MSRAEIRQPSSWEIFANRWLRLRADEIEFADSHSVAAPKPPGGA